MLSRQARLRTAFRDWYPKITPDAWHHALWVREMALAGQRQGGPRWELTGRVLSDDHFDFQGGTDRGGTPGQERRLARPNGSGAA